MEAIGAASAIIGVAQFGLQFSQVLVTVIGDYRDAAKNINHLRDEIHLASICLQQLGDLASRDLLRQYGILEATNLRERCQAVFWEIRGKVKKGDHPLNPIEITKEQIDVTYFTSLKWALWTKKQLEEPRQELDRLKGSMTLCFVSHMAILATSDLDKARYASQIPGIKRSLAWSEKTPVEDILRERLEKVGIPPEKIAEILGEESVSSEPAMPSPVRAPTPSVNQPSQTSGVNFRAYSIDSLAPTSEVPVSQEWITQFLNQNYMEDPMIWRTHSKLHPWFKKEIETISRRLNTDEKDPWNLVFIKPLFKNFLKHGPPKNVQVVMKRYSKAVTIAQQPVTETVAYTIDEPMTMPIEVYEDYSQSPAGQIVVEESAILPNSYVRIEPRKAEPEEIEKTDEEIIAHQLALYQ